MVDWQLVSSSCSSGALPFKPRPNRQFFWWKRDAWAQILAENANYNDKNACARLLVCILLF